MAKNRRSSVDEGSVRIIAGRWRGRRLTFPAVRGLRPTGDRVKETLFNWLAPHLIDAYCLDLFAGSGALGFEAASRQVTRVTMVDDNVQVCAALKHHCQALAADNVTVVQSDALGWLASVDSSSRPFDIVFLDPPFNSPLLGLAMAELETGNHFAKDALLYIECSSANCLLDWAGEEHWQLYRHKMFGTVDVRLYRRRQ